MILRPKRLSKKGARFIANFEGFVPTPYNDAVGNATIAYGHMIHPGPVKPADKKGFWAYGREWPGLLTREQGQRLLELDALAFAEGISHLVKVRLGLLPARAQARFDALVSFAYNLGLGALEESSLLQLVNKRGAPRDWSVPAAEFVKWDHAGGVELEGLKKRREAEAHLFLTGKY